LDQKTKEKALQREKAKKMTHSAVDFGRSVAVPVIKNSLELEKIK